MYSLQSSLIPFESSAFRFRDGSIRRIRLTDTNSRSFISILHFDRFSGSSYSNPRARMQAKSITTKMFESISSKSEDERRRDGQAGKTPIQTPFALLAADPCIPEIEDTKNRPAGLTQWERLPWGKIQDDSAFLRNDSWTGARFVREFTIYCREKLLIRNFILFFDRFQSLSDRKCRIGGSG